MNRKTILTCVFALFACVNIYADDFGTWFYNKPMRFDYYHAGSATTEYLFFDEIIEEPYYAGSKTNLIDDFGYGNYRFSLYDKASGKLIYRRGYDNLMKEWRTIPEAEIFSKAMPESIVFPYPRKEVKLVIEARDRRNVFHELYTYDLDPESYFIRKSQPSLQTMEIAYQGNSDHCVDLVLIPEGYTEADKALFEEDCHKFADYLFSYAPYGDNKGRFNVRAVWAPSQDAGVSIPGENVWRNTACKVQYYTFDSERYQMTMDMQNLRDIAGNAPYEYIYIISNSQKYGGGAIYNWYGISAAHIFSRPESVRKTYAHEFGHLLLGLGDERRDKILAVHRRKHEHRLEKDEVLLAELVLPRQVGEEPLHPIEYAIHSLIPFCSFRSVHSPDEDRRDDNDGSGEIRLAREPLLGRDADREEARRVGRLRHLLEGHGPRLVAKPVAVRLVVRPDIRDERDVLGLEERVVEARESARERQVDALLRSRRDRREVEVRDNIVDRLVQRIRAALVERVHDAILVLRRIDDGREHRLVLLDRENGAALEDFLHIRRRSETVGRRKTSYFRGTRTRGYRSRPYA